MKAPTNFKLRYRSSKKLLRSCKKTFMPRGLKKRIYSKKEIRENKSSIL
jgi:hypothetical protein